MQTRFFGLKPAEQRVTGVLKERALKKNLRNSLPPPVYGIPLSEMHIKSHIVRSKLQPVQGFVQFLSMPVMGSKHHGIKQ